MFEHLGWMAMAKKHNNSLKIKCYLDSIKRLLDCLERKKNNTKDEDRIDDLHVLIDNTKCLDDCAQYLLNDSSHNSNKSSKSIKSIKSINTEHLAKAHNATYQGLHCWMKHKFEKLGWMCLAKKHGNSLKVQCYLDSIERLMASLEKKLNELHEEDRKDDIKIIRNDVDILQAAAHKLLGNSKYSLHTKSRITSRKRTRRTSSWF